MIEAAANGHKDTMLALLAAGSNREARSSDGASPLIIATMFNKVDCALALCDSGCLISAKDKVHHTSHSFEN